MTLPLTNLPYVRRSFDWLPVRALWPDGRLRMTDVRHTWQGSGYAFAPDKSGRIPARHWAHGRFTPGWYEPRPGTHGLFIKRQED